MMQCSTYHNDVIKWKHFPRYWPFVRGVHRSPVNSPHKGQWCGVLMFSLVCNWINGWLNNREAGDLRHCRAHYDVTVMIRSCVALFEMKQYGLICVYFSTKCFYFVDYLTLESEITVPESRQFEINWSNQTYTTVRLTSPDCFRVGVGVQAQLVCWRCHSRRMENGGSNEFTTNIFQCRPVSLNIDPWEIWMRPSDAIRLHKSWSTLAQVMTCCLTAPGHCLNQYWLITSEIHCQSPEIDLTRFKKQIAWKLLIWKHFIHCQLLGVSCEYVDGCKTVVTTWASYQIRKIAGCACAGNAGNVFPATDFKGNRGLAIPACITACRDR